MLSRAPLYPSSLLEPETSPREVRTTLLQQLGLIFLQIFCLIVRAGRPATGKLEPPRAPYCTARTGPPAPGPSARPHTAPYRPYRASSARAVLLRMLPRTLLTRRNVAKASFPCFNSWALMGLEPFPYICNVFCSWPPTAGKARTTPHRPPGSILPPLRTATRCPIPPRTAYRPVPSYRPYRPPPAPYRAVPPAPFQRAETSPGKVLELFV